MGSELWLWADKGTKTRVRSFLSAVEEREAGKEGVIIEWIEDQKEFMGTVPGMPEINVYADTRAECLQHAEYMIARRQRKVADEPSG